MRRCRRLFFTSVKTDILKSLVKATTTPTSLSHDEYELPRDIRTVRVNRLKARKALDDENQVGKKEHSIFGQMQSELRGWSGNTLRRGYVARGHGGQPRAFKVKLIGEGVNDYSGPYREVRLSYCVTLLSHMCIYIPTLIISYSNSSLTGLY